MKSRNGINNHPQSRKGVANRIVTQNNQGTEKKTENGHPSTKEKDENLQILIKQYLQKNGYARTAQAFKTQKPIKRTNTVVGSHRAVNDEQKNILQMFDKGHRQQFFKHTAKIFNNPETVIKKLQFQINVYFCIYTIHPCIRKGTQMDRASSEAFKKYIDSKGSEVAEHTELLSFFALPHIPKPQEHSGMAHVFTKEWIQKLRLRVQEIVKENFRQNVNYNKKTKTGLEEIYERMTSEKEANQKEEESECKQNCKHMRQLGEAKMQNKEMLNYVDIIQQNLKDLNEVSKANLIESNKKWFQFSKDILHLARRAVKGEKVEKLQKYEKFFGSNIDELIYNSNEMSIFEKNSYFTEDISLVPQHIKDISQRKLQQKKEPQLCQIDMHKILILFNKADKPEYEREICMALKALKDRFYQLKKVQRRQIIVSYKRTDICAIKKENQGIQKKLLLDSTEKVKEFYLRFLNHITTDNLGNQYLSSSQKLIENLIGILGSTNEEVPYRKHVFGILQRFSYLKQAQVQMISFGMIPIIFKIFRNEGEELTFNSIQYLMGLIMNLAINREWISSFEKHKTEILTLLLKYIDVDDVDIRGYVNGTLYVLLQMSSFKNEAGKYKLETTVMNLLEKYELKLEAIESEEEDERAEDYNLAIKQYNYILKRLEESPNNDSQFCQQSDDDDYDEEDEFDDLSSHSDEDNSSEYIDGVEGFDGEQFLMKRFALLGPEAVREQFLTRSILDETGGRKSQNMTTSINHSKRIDKVFQRNETYQNPTVLPNLDLSAPHMFK